MDPSSSAGCTDTKTVLQITCGVLYEYTGYGSRGGGAARAKEDPAPHTPPPGPRTVKTAVTDSHHDGGALQQAEACEKVRETYFNFSCIRRRRSGCCIQLRARQPTPTRPQRRNLNSPPHDTLRQPISLTTAWIAVNCRTTLHPHALLPQARSSSLSETTTCWRSDASSVSTMHEPKARAPELSQQAPDPPQQKTNSAITATGLW